MRTFNHPIHSIVCLLNSNKMATSSADGKMLVNALYHGVIVTGIAIGYSRLGRMMIGGQTPKLDYTPRDVGMIAIDISLAMATKDILIKQGIIPADILK